MGQDLGVRVLRDNEDTTMARGERSDVMASDDQDVSTINKMGDGKNVSKMGIYINSTKNGHKSKVR